MNDHTSPTAASFSHLAIVVDDIDSSRHFYERVLGFTSSPAVFRGRGKQLASIMGVAHAAVEGLFMRRGTFVLELLRYVEYVEGAGVGSRRRAPSDSGYAHLSFIVDNVAATMDAACANGGSARRDSLAEVPMGSAPPIVMGFIEDPGHNAIELIAHADAAAAAAHAAFLRADSIGWPPVSDRPA